jgi:hypothetical protein
MTMIATTKRTGNFMPGSGIGFNRGRLAGGRTTPVPFGKTDVFGKRVLVNVPVPAHRGGLIDKLQQADPSATAVFSHPFDGSGYRGISTQPGIAPITTVNNLPVANPLKTVNKVNLLARGTFFAPHKPIPVVKTQFGANKSGLRSNTSFHPTPLPRQAAAESGPAIDSAKTVNRNKPASFATTGNIWSDPHNSFVKGTNSITNPNRLGQGRWNTIKRSVT